MLFSETRKKRDSLFFIVTLLLSILIFLLPGHSQAIKPDDSVRVRSEIIAVDNSEINQFGLIKTGDQGLKVKILNGKYKNRELDAVNLLIGKMELDKIFSIGDITLTVLDLDKGEIIHAQVIDHYRIRVELILFALFTALIILYSGWTGLRALTSFIFTGLIIWKILIPGFLLGINPIILSNLTVALFTGVIIFLIAGLNRTGLSAFISSISGVILTTVISLTFGKFFKVNGAVKPFTEMLLYSGYANLDITKILLSGIFIASSGAVMDIAMDISASMKEVADKKNDITQVELLKSGIRVGRAVVGTMTTTLLLAYSGGYTGLLMVFIAQGTPIINILNLSYVSAEILHILVGSFGLITVAPLTALIGSFLLQKRKI